MITCHNVFNVWPKITLLPVWPRDAKRWDTPEWQRETLLGRNVNRVNRVPSCSFCLQGEMKEVLFYTDSGIVFNDITGYLGLWNE